jgi:hypothetical protein
MTDPRLDRDYQIDKARQRRSARIGGWAKAMKIKLTKPSPEQVDESERRWEDLRRQI